MTSSPRVCACQTTLPNWRRIKHRSEGLICTSTYHVEPKPDDLGNSMELSADAHPLLHM